MPTTSAARDLATPPADHYLAVTDARLRFRDEGAGPAVVLLHGWTLDLEMWDPQVARLRQQFRLVRVDRRGHGYSGGTPTPDHDAADVAALCDHLGLRRVAVVGMSQGARSALTFASNAPASVAALVLDGPPSFELRTDWDVPLDDFRLLVQTRGMAAFRQEWLRHPLTQLRNADPQVHALLAAMIERFAGNEFSDWAARAVAPAATLARLPAAPALVLSGEFDLPSRIHAAKQLSALLAGAERAVVSGAGHLPNLDRPDAYSEMLRTFLNLHMGPRA